MSREIKFDIWDNVEIIDLKLSGYINQICLSEFGISYQVRYFSESQQREAWLRDVDMKLKSSSKVTYAHINHKE